MDGFKVLHCFTVIPYTILGASIGYLGSYLYCKICDISLESRNNGFNIIPAAGHLKYMYLYVYAYTHNIQISHNAQTARLF